MYVLTLLFGPLHYKFNTSITHFSSPHFLEEEKKKSIRIYTLYDVSCTKSIIFAQKTHPLNLIKSHGCFILYFSFLILQVTLCNQIIRAHNKHICWVLHSKIICSKNIILKEFLQLEIKHSVIYKAHTTGTTLPHRLYDYPHPLVAHPVAVVF